MEQGKGADELPPLETDTPPSKNEASTGGGQTPSTQSLTPDPFVQSMREKNSAFNSTWPETADEYFLIMYIVMDPKLQTSLPTLHDVFNYLDEHGELLDKWPFKEGTTTKFFKTLKQYTNVDMMVMLSSSVEFNPYEDELCAGVLPFEDALNALDKLQPLVKGQAGEKERFQEMSKKNGLKDPEWAFTTAIGIAKALEKAVPATAGNKGIIMGLYE